MTSDDKRDSQASLPLAIKAFGYLVFQLFLLWLVGQLPWPVVLRHTVSSMYARVIPAPVFAMFWIQAIIGSCLPLRSKAFLAGQFIVFAFLFFVFCEVEDKARGAVISSVVHNLYWIQFVATALGFLYLSVGQSKVRAMDSKFRPWYPLLTYVVIQLAVLWVISDGVWGLAGGKGLILLAFWGQSFGLLFVPNRLKFFVSAEILLALSLFQLAYWLPTGWYSPHSPMSNWLWVAFLTQCSVLSWWLFFRPTRHFTRHA